MSAPSFREDFRSFEPGLEALYVKLSGQAPDLTVEEIEAAMLRVVKVAGPKQPKKPEGSK